ncbi:hypothetical protein JXC34_00250 [Candidatus Woesearchaeota archaeon]|nr:hypothetical protein [Candidatus Woesearchaeota archaeon]
MVKVADFKDGMKDIDIVVEIDYVPQRFTGQNWGIVFVKDDSKDIKMILKGENMKKAKEGMKLRIKKGFVSMTRGELQLNPSKDHPIEFVEENEKK